MKSETRGYLVFIAFLVALATLLSLTNFPLPQTLSITVFASMILGTFLFWRFRLGIAALGVAVLLVTKTLDVKTLVEFMSIDVIVFLFGMMVVVALLKNVGFFEWFMVSIINMTRWDPKKLMLAFMALSALMAALVDEVTSILIISALILETCDHLNIDPKIYIITAVLATNIGSSATVLGNPIGILIALRAELGFEDFLRWATPVSVAALVAFMPLALLTSRRQLAEDTKKVEFRLKRGIPAFLSAYHMVSDLKRMKIGIAVFAVVIALIGFHSRLESLLGLDRGSLLISASLLGAGMVLIIERRRAHEVVEKGVDWGNLVFFMFLFANAGALHYSGVTELMARGIVQFSGSDPVRIMSIILLSSATLSGVVDNVPLVAAFIPVVQNFNELNLTNPFPLWWALLFGGTFGGNLTLIGSTANIVALSLLERRKGVTVSFMAWFKLGLVCFLVTVAVAWVLLLVQMPYMPNSLK